MSALDEGKPDVLAKGADYQEQAVLGRLDKIKEGSSVPPHIGDGDMQRLYKQGLLRQNSSARTDVYEKLRVSSPYRVCPFCLHRTVKTLDHYLPKESYAAFAVLPANLVPCCRDCNSEKLCFVGVDRSKALIHPYYDRIDHQGWLGCELSFEHSHWSPTFFVNSLGVDPAIKSRLISHMETLDLFELYDTEGARELNDMRLSVRKSFQSGGSDAVKDLCATTAQSRRALANNYWRAVLWEAASQDPAYCSATWA